MHSHDFLPTALLRPFIKGYKIIESSHEMVNRILPGTSPALAFRFKGQTNYINSDSSKDQLPTATLSGLRKTVRLIQYENNSSTLIVLFKAGGAPAFFRQPLYELFEESISLDHVVHRSKVAQIEEQLAAAATHHQRVAVVENFLLSQLQPKDDMLVLAALKEISTSKGNLRISDLIQSLPISTDAFEKRFRKIVSTSPKQYATIVRLQNLVRKGQTNQSLTQLALEAGYFDQRISTKTLNYSRANRLPTSTSHLYSGKSLIFYKIFFSGVVIFEEKSSR